MMSRAYWLPLWLLLWLIMAPTQAATINEAFDGFTPEQQTVSQELLRQIFGKVVPTIRGDDNPDEIQDTAFVVALETFTSIVLAIAGLILAYVVIAGIAQTAQSGEVLGKSWNSMWVPLRGAIGLAAVIPLPVLSGLSSVQGMVIAIAIFGSGLADQTWGVITTATIENGLVAAPSVDFGSEFNGAGSSEKFIVGLLESWMCVHALNAHRGDDEQLSSRVSNSPESITDLSVSGVQHRVFEFGSEANPQICGKISVPIASVIGQNLDDFATENGLAGANNFFTAQQLETSTALKNLLLDIYRLSVDGQVTAMEVLSELIFNNPFQTDAEKGEVLRSIVIAHNEFIRTTATDIYLAESEALVQRFKDSAEEGGWVMAGAFMWKLNELTAMVSKIINENSSQMQIIGPSSNLSSHELFVLAQVKNRIDQIKRLAGNTSGFDAERLGLDGGNFDANDLRGNPKVSDIFGGLSKHISLLTDALLKENESPLAKLQNIGDAMLIVAKQLIEFSLEVAETQKEGAMHIVGPIVNSMVNLFTTLGWLLSFYIPALPFLVFLAGTLTWLVLVVEAMVASPIWAVMLLSPSGEGVQQQIKPGLLIFLSLILRPVLMLFGLTAALALMFVGTYLVEQTIIPAMVFTGATSPMQVMATFVLYVGLLVFMANYTFKLINTLPDEVLKYIGHAGDGKGTQTGEQLTQAAESNIKGFGGFVGNAEHIALAQERVSKPNSGNSSVPDSTSIALPSSDSPASPNSVSDDNIATSAGDTGAEENNVENTGEFLGGAEYISENEWNNDPKV